MALKQKITQAVNQAFIALDDLKGPMTVTVQTADPTYVAATGVVSKTEKTVSVEAVFDRYDTDRVDGTVIQREDRLILVKPKTDFEPGIGDTIEDADGITYNIMDVDAIKAYDQVFLWELQARK
jgi:hypothetical protein